jgi:hypothetical protein
MGVAHRGGIVTRRKQRWSIQVDEYPAKGEKMFGPRTVIASYSEPGEISHRYDNVTVVPDTEVDEIFIDGWLHVEAMSDREYWMSVGGIDINVTVGKDGRAKKVTYRVEGEPGVEYVDDSPARPV